MTMTVILNNKPRTIVLLAVLSLALCRCDQSSQSSLVQSQIASGARSTNMEKTDPVTDAALTSLLKNYLIQVFAELELSIQESAVFNQRIAQFLSAPEPDTLETLRSAWISAQGSYESITLHRYFLQQLLSFGSTGIQLDLSLDALNYRINYWPILPGYIDYLQDHPESGIVNDITIALTADEISRQHGAFDVSEIILGFHPLEFLLWGQNSPEGTNLRSANDFMVIASLSTEQLTEGLLLEELGNNRRRALLEQLGIILESDLRSALQMWQLNRASLEELIESLGSSEKFSIIFDSIATMLTDELLVRSLYLLLNSNIADSLQSPYSHSTQNAVISQLSSIENLLNTSGDDGLSMEMLLMEMSPEFALNFPQNFDDSKECLALLYTTAQTFDDPVDLIQSETEIVNCINLVSNLVNSMVLAKQQSQLSRGAF